ncbi:MAG TPA: GTP-binding protein [Rhodobacteraceae bacterium]|nr:GTP-binding protein [Amylibacter sp.]MDG1999970.1 GTP-binding protein [Amylibacter sp.]HAD28783.1 GTP-binding protein [Paracoccaceae bacterium]
MLSSSTETRIPVTVLTGFLGAGKTTLLNAILSDKSGPKIAVIVNEFGEAGLDHSLIETVDEEIVLMQSGCLCCSIRGDLSRTVQDLVNRKNAGLLQFDRVVIETTGLADPGPILQTLLVDLYLAKTVRTDGVVTVVDAATGANTLDQQFEAVSQVAMADLLILSKTDLMPDAKKTELETRLRGLNPTVNIFRSVKGLLPTVSLWNLSGMRRGGGQKNAMDWVMPSKLTSKSPNPLQNISGLQPSQKNVKPTLRHDDRIESVSIVLNEPISVARFDHWLDTLVMLRGPNILRVKGIVHLEDIEKPFVFHGVQHLFDPPVPLQDWAGTSQQSRIVVIARDMTREELEYSLNMLREPNQTLTKCTSDKELLP